MTRKMDNETVERVTKRGGYRMNMEQGGIPQPVPEEPGRKGEGATYTMTDPHKTQNHRKVTTTFDGRKRHEMGVWGMNLTIDTTNK